MRRTPLLVLAAASAMCTTAPAGAVQLYGTIDLGLTHYTGLAAGAAGAGPSASTGLSSGVQTPSFIGVRGTERLSPGLVLLFDAETGFCAAGVGQDLSTSGSLNGGVAGPQTFCTRNTGLSTGGGFMQKKAYLALSGRYGTLLAGQGRLAIDRNEVDMDPFHAGLTGSISNLSLLGQYGDTHQNEGVGYSTPSLGGLKAGVAYSFAPTQGTIPEPSTAAPSALNALSNVTRSQSAFVRYTAGALTLGAAYAQTTSLPLPAMLDPVTKVDDGNLTGWQMYGAWRFDRATVSGLYERATTNYTAGQARFFMLGLTVPAGRGAVLASYDQTRIDPGMQYINLQSTNPAAMVSLHGTATQYALGYTYPLSRQTNLYASYARIVNDAHTDFAVGSASDGFLGCMGQDSSGMALGIRHSF